MFSPANVIFAGADVLLSVAIVLYFTRFEWAHTGPIQAAQGVIASHDTLVIVFDQIESFFKRLEEFAYVNMTEPMKDIMVEIMVEALEIFAIMTKEIKQNRESE